MDNPGTSLFQTNEIININNSQNNEEEEDLEEQKRRNEEIHNILLTKLDEFNYDDSTLNSSANISAISMDDVQKNYRDAIDPLKQLQVLYEVRVREVNALREELDKTLTEKGREIDDLKNRLFVFEAENKQLKISLKNSEDLLVEKTKEINDLNVKLSKHQEQIEKYEQMIKDYQLDINTYRSTISELQMKLQTEPFDYANKKFNSSELHKAHAEQITKLESSLEQQKKNNKIYEKEVAALREELEKLAILQGEDKSAISILTNNFDSAQKQCHELIEIVESLSAENQHLKERLKEKDLLNLSQEVDSPFVEKLKKALVDKSMENDTLKAKVKNFEENLKELMEYRALKSDIYKKEFQQCDNKEHIRSLLLMQNDLQNYRRIIDDKNQQVLTLNSTNNDLLQKMELMLSQTRDDIQNISNKYNLPQLEEMADELKKSEATIKELELQLQISEEKRLSLAQKLQRFSFSPRKDGRKEFELKINNLEKEKNNYENELKKLQKEYEIAVVEIKNLKAYIDEILKESTKLKLELKAMSGEAKNMAQDADSVEELKRQLTECFDTIYRNQNMIKDLKDNVEDLVYTKNVLEESKANLELQLKEQQHLVKTKCEEIEKLNNSIKEKDDLIKNLKNDEDLRQELLLKNEMLKKAEENEQKLLKELEQVKKEIEEAKTSNNEENELKLHKELEKVKAELEEAKKLRNQTENKATPSESSEDREMETLNLELKLREEIQHEYTKKLQEIEKKYSVSCKAIYKEQNEKLKSQEINFRNQLSTVLKECAQKMKLLEDENEKLFQQIRDLRTEHDQYKNHVIVNEEKYLKMIDEAKHSAKKTIGEWKKWSKKLVNSSLQIEATNKAHRDKILNDMIKYDAEITAIKKSYNGKIKKYINSCHN